MKIFYVLCITFSLVCRGQSGIKPSYIIADKNIKLQKLEKTDDILLFYLSTVQYLGKAKPLIELNYTYYYGYNPILKNNYERPTDIMNTQYKDDYENVRIFVDINQTTPLNQTETDFTKITEEEFLTEIDRMNLGKRPTREIPQITTYYDGFPVTLYNQENKDVIIGFGNHIPLELEALNKENNWVKIYGRRIYICGVGIQYIMLKSQQIATVFQPRLSGSFKTKLRYRLKNIVSNEFEGNINENYFRN
ncbi:hypothetical protein [Chryseobacterium kwangjuense]|uniref:Uncharacterized protein n=1 Tax=Chryseobacterium kwangjuense TaxID=267125 RepID=A0A135WLN6_9FLAO|nr:hypothetical protein [Chryseobacterium kwangjuense]KXH85826.1 hypothetical protein AU378_08815 [Chryseobacterium kwangjuense]